jgi:beta-lactam-binding protein with PASTA domain
MLSFLKDKRFYINLVVILLLTAGIVWLTLTAIDKFTRHGQEISVPDFTGLYYNELGENPDFSRFDFLVIDSIYEPTKEKGTIIHQDPKPESLVKEGRTIYLTVVAINPKMVTVPLLKDLSLRQATSLLQTYNLKVGKLSYEPDIARNAVLRTLYRGEELDSGVQVVAGSAIDLVLGLGEQQELIPVPILIGLHRSEAIKVLHEYSLNIGEEHFDEGDDTSLVRIYRQNPNFTTKSVAKYGSDVELWYKSDKNFDFDAYLKKIYSDTLAQDSLNKL